MQSLMVAAMLVTDAGLSAVRWASCRLPGPAAAGGGVSWWCASSSSFPSGSRACALRCINGLGLAQPHGGACQGRSRRGYAMAEGLGGMGTRSWGEHPWLLGPASQSSLRVGEAQNPGPEEGGGDEVDDLGDSREPQIPTEEDWVPAWKRWSVPITHPAERGRPSWVELVPPHLAAVTRQEIRGHDWDDEELERFLQQAEVDAGWRDAVDHDRARRAKAEWEELETDLMMLGIRPPGIVEHGDRGAANAQDSGVADAPHERECTAEDTLGLASMCIDSAPTRREGGTRGTKKKRIVWQHGLMHRDGEPLIQEATISPRDVVNPTPQCGPAESIGLGSLGSSPSGGQGAKDNGQRRKRPRGKRMRGGRGEEEWAVDIVHLNGSGAPQLIAALKSLGGDRGRTAALLVQEHHARGAALADLDDKVRKLGWKLAPTAATDGRKGGNSAGTAVIVPAHIDWGLPPGGTWDISPPGSAGRLTAAWVRAGVKCGMTCISCYCWTREGPTTRNLALVEKGLAVAAAMGLPWVMSGDFNMAPEELWGAARLVLERAGATVRRTGTATNYPGVGEPREIDFFLIDTKLAAAESEARVDDRISGEPHRAVVITVKGKLAGGLVQAARRPKGFPSARPIGCPRRPVTPDNMEERARAIEAGTTSQDDTMDSIWADLARCAEAELCRECDLVDAEGRPLQAYLGRGEGFSLKWKQLLPERVTGPAGRGDSTLHCMMSVLNRLEELVHLGGIAERVVGGLTAGQRIQWHRVVFNLRRRRGPLDRLAASDARFGALQALLLHVSPGASGWLSELRAAATLAREAIDGHKRVLAQERLAAWKAWVTEQIKKGGGALHKFVKRQLAPSDVAVDPGAMDCRAAPQALVEADLDEWSKVWGRLEGIARAPWRDADPALDVAALPQPSPRELRRAASTFRPHTGVGCDHFRPAWFSWLSDALLKHLAAFFLLIEAAGKWPPRLALTLVHLIPKEAGGRRPIGLLASFTRLWERVRAPVVRQWRLECWRPYNWSAPGRSAERAVWIQSITDEAARGRGLESASTLIDLVKAFEHIPLELLWRQARKHNFPLVLMRLVLELCASPRRLVFKKAVSGAIETLSAVIAGLVMATDCMYLAIIDVMDNIVLRFPRVRLCTYVDDLTLGRIGTSEVVAAELRAATEYCVHQLETHCQLVVSRAAPGRDEGTAKSVAVASTRRMRRLLMPMLKKVGLRMVTRTKLLGVDYCPGPASGPRRPAQAKRWSKVYARRGRVRRLGAVGGRHVTITGAVPGARYGASVTGVSCVMVRQLGTMAAEVHGRLNGRSVTARLGVRGSDPRFEVLLRPLRAWVEEVWRRELDVDLLQDAWKWAQRTVGLSARPTRAATTAAAAYLSTIARLGWKCPSFDAVLTREGFLLRVGDVDVTAVMRLAVDDLAIVLAADSEIAKDIEDLSGERGHYRTLPGVSSVGVTVELEPGAVGEHVAGSLPEEAHSARVWRNGRYQLLNGRLIPWLTPACMVLKRRLNDARRCTAADRSVAALVEGGWFTPVRLHAMGLRLHATCRACMRAAGTLWHRLGGCEVTAEPRQADGGCPRWLWKKGSVSVWDPLFSRGVPALPKIPPPPQEVTRWAYRARLGEATAATGDVYSDGALSGRLRRAMRAGWGLVCLEPGADKVNWACYGTMDDINPSIIRAELRAVLEALRVAVPPLRIHIDNAEVVRGWRNGEAWCVDPVRDGADIWRLIWFQLKEIGEGVTFLKVKAHTEGSAVEMGLITHRDRLGNALADKCAKEGARLGEALSPTGALRAELTKAIRWYYWARRAAAIWVKDIGDDAREADARTPMQGKGSGRAAGTGLRHLVWEKAGDLLCRRCGRLADTELKKRSMQSSRCLGSAAGRLLARACNDPEALGRQCVYGYMDMRSRGWRSRTAEDADPRGGPDSRPLFDEGGSDSSSDEGGQGSGSGVEDASARASAHSVPGGSADHLVHGGSAQSVTHSPPAPAEPPGGPSLASLVSHAGPRPDVKRARLSGSSASHGGGAPGVEGLVPLSAPSSSCASQGRAADPSQSREAHLDRGGRDERPSPPEAGGTGVKRARHAIAASASSSTSRVAEQAHVGTGRGNVGIDASELRDLGADAGSASSHHASALAEAATTGSRSRSGSAEREADHTPVAAQLYGRRRVSHVADPVDACDSRGHTLVITGAMVWCARCGRHAVRRIGRALQTQCPGFASGVYVSRLARLRRAQHPITGDDLVPG